MNLGQFVSIVCAYVNRTDVDSKTACATFLNNRYGTIYDSYPWRDSEIVSAPLNFQSVPSPDIFIEPPPDPGPQPQFQTVSFPSGMDRIVKVGLVSLAGGLKVVTDLRPTDSAYLMETRPEAIFGSGIPEFYEELNTSDVGRIIKVYPAPVASAAYQLLVVGKKTINTLNDNADFPILRNIDDTLIAYGIADMLKRDRHYAKAAQQLQEADKSLQAMIELEQKQSNAPRASRPLSITGGTLGELVDAVSSRTSQWSAAAQIRIQEAIRRRYQELYDRALWTESVVMLSMQAQGGQMILPNYIDRIIAVADEANSTIDIRELEYLFRTDPGLFDSQGSPVIFSLLPPVGVAVLPASTEPLSLISSSTDDSFTVEVSGEASGVYRKEYVQISGATSSAVSTYYSYDVPITVSKPSNTLGTLTIGGAVSLTKFGEIPPELSQVQYQRLWVQPIDATSANGMYFVLGKRKLQQLVNQVDAVTIRGCESALIAMACADVVPQEQSQAFTAEAEKQIKILLEKETNQNARRATVVPYTDRDSYQINDVWLRASG